MKFKAVVKPTNEGQTFDITESVEKAGEKYVYYDRIQAARQDTEVYPTLEKYGILDPIQINKEQMYLDIRDLDKTDRRSIEDYMKKADNLWNQLPGDLKDKFENNRDLFMKNGEKWLKDEIEKESKTHVNPEGQTIKTEGQTNE